MFLNQATNTVISVIEEQEGTICIVDLEAETDTENKGRGRIVGTNNINGYSLVGRKRWIPTPETRVRIFLPVLKDIVEIRVWCNGSIRVSKTLDGSSNLSTRAINNDIVTTAGMSYWSAKLGSWVQFPPMSQRNSIICYIYK